MDWQFKPPAKSSSVSGEPFDEGERVCCFLYLDEQAQLQRTDVRESEAEGLAVPGRLLGRWTRMMKAPEEERREARKQALATGEEMFLGLYASEAPPSEEQDTLKQLLALMLERKRVLRALGKPAADTQIYLHVKSREEFSVPMRRLEPAQVMQIQAQLDALVV